MLPKKRRIRTASFGEIIKKGGFGSSPLFSTRELSVKSDSETAFSVVVSKKVAKSAPLRNKTRRKYYHAIREYTEKLKNPTKIIFFIRKEGITAKFEEIKKQVKASLSKSGHIA